MSCARFVSTPPTPAPIPRPHFFLLPFSFCLPSLTPASVAIQSYPWQIPSCLLLRFAAPSPRKLQNKPNSAATLAQTTSSICVHLCLSVVPASSPSLHATIDLLGALGVMAVPPLPKLQNKPNSRTTLARHSACSSGYSEFTAPRPSPLASPLPTPAKVQNKPNSPATPEKTISSICTLPRTPQSPGPERPLHINFSNSRFADRPTDTRWPSCLGALYVQNNAICLFYNECPRPQGGA